MIETDARFITDLLRQLVRINSVNPSLDPAAPGETEIAAFTAGALERLGLEVQRLETQPGRTSVVGRLPGTGHGRSLMLNAHFDTVATDGMAQPFAARVEAGRLYGRGAYDMKGSLAACIGAVEALLRTGQRPAGDLLIAAVADEEHASLGTADVIRHCKVDGAIVTEPTSLRLCPAHKGFVWLEVTTHGRAAHGSRPDLGVDANVRMGRVLVELERLAKRLENGPRHPLLGPGSVHAATLEGGTGLSTYAAECHLGIERRTVPGETEAGVLAEIEGILAGLRAADPTFHASVRPLLARPPFEARPDSPLLAVLGDAAERVMGERPAVAGETPWMDSALLAEAGVDTVVMGPHGAGAHAAEEWVDLESVERLAQILAEAALAYCV